MTEKKSHVYLRCDEILRGLKVAAAQLGVTVTDLVSDVLFELPYDVHHVPPGVTGAEALKVLRELRKRRREGGTR